MSYIGKAPQLQGTYLTADDISASFNGVLLTFNILVSTVAKTVGKAENLIVGYSFVAGTYPAGKNLLLQPNVDYTVSGSTITFTGTNFTPAVGDTCWITILGDVLSVSA